MKTAYEHGAAGDTWPANEFQEAFGVAFIPLPPLGDEPEIDDGLGPPNETPPQFERRLKAWDRRSDKHALNNEALSKLRIAFLQGLTPAAKIHALNKTSETTITLRALVDNFTAYYCKKTNALDDQRAVLRKVYVAGDDISLHLAAMAAALKAFDDHLEPIPPENQRNYLIESIKPCGLFTFVLNQCSILDEQPTFEELCGKLDRWAESDTFVEASQRNYANAATATPDAVALSATETLLKSALDRVDALAANVEELKLNRGGSHKSNGNGGGGGGRHTKRAAVGGGQQATAGRGPRPASVITTTPPPTTHWCWSHGHNWKHNSDKCPSPWDEHKWNATITKPQNGCMTTALYRG